MMRLSRLSPLALGLAALWACSDSSSSNGFADVIAGPDAAARDAACDVRDGERATRSLFGQPQQNEAAGHWDRISDGCVDGVAPSGPIFDLVGLVATQADSAEDGDGFGSSDAGLAATAVNVALGLLSEPPTSPIPPEVFGPDGAAGVRGTGSKDVRSRTPVPLALTRERGTLGSDTLHWMVGALPRGDATWGDVLGGEAFVWGHPVDTTAYEWNTTPRFGAFGAQVDVVFCLEETKTLPGDEQADGGQPRVRKSETDSATVLQPAGVDLDESLCDEWWDGESTSTTGLLGLARELFLPEPLYAFQIDGDGDAELSLTIRGVGGGTIDFSPFEPWSVDPEGFLEWNGPDFVDEPTVGEALFASPLEVTAFTGGREPIEEVTITLTVEDNNGVPAGAVLGSIDDNGSVTPFTAVTSEPGGTAVFDVEEDQEDPVVLAPNKPGGYRLCAEGSFDGFSFTRVCTTEPFNVKNAN